MSQLKNTSEQILEFYNNSQYRGACQIFFDSKGIKSPCNYFYSVYNVTLNINQGYVFHCIVPDKIVETAENSINQYKKFIHGTEYAVKITKDFVITDWYKSKLIDGIEGKYYSGLDLETNEEIEYYTTTIMKDDMNRFSGFVATKYNAKTKEEKAKTYFVHYNDLPEEKQKQLDAIPYGKTMTGYRERDGQFIIEYLPSFFQYVFDGHNIKSFDPNLLTN